MEYLTAAPGAIARSLAGPLCPAAKLSTMTYRRGPLRPGVRGTIKYLRPRSCPGLVLSRWNCKGSHLAPCCVITSEPRVFVGKPLTIA